ncbi:type IV-A pilus assembly ATPase PilB [Gammaproteobacteria bacterium LSUCC0112]|nr:type IV-A pilus assembly ATPase PilB [Gammaproteobacteria bacterium LSUCC0112]
MLANRLPDILVEQGLITPHLMEQTLALAAREQLPLISLLIRQDNINTLDLATLIARAFSCPLFDLTCLNNTELPVFKSWMRRCTALPISQTGQVVHVAIADPACLGLLTESGVFAKQLLQPVIVDGKQLDLILKQLDGKGENTQHCQPTDTTTQELTVLMNDSMFDDPVQAADINESANEAPIVRFVNQVLLDAVRQRASDIHIEPYESSCRIRFRIDGILRENTSTAARLAARVGARLKVMASLDINERRRPQDGRIRIKLADNRFIDLRISTLPTLWGEKIVLRVLDSSGVKLPMNALGFSPVQLQIYRDALNRRQGMILVTGPTGSGKTVTLYSGLGYLNAIERNISTAEDPVEINLEGVNQVAVNRRSGLDFASTLRAFLRQDPDVVMLGEIRDQETADIAVKAAQTGHLVLSTLHTNSAAETINRLMNMGIEAYNLASALTLVISQRLARRLCVNCREWVDSSTQDTPGQFIHRMPENVCIAKGCRQCNDGYRGRIALVEVLPINAEIAEKIALGADVRDIEATARLTGATDLFGSALSALASGDTSLDEIRRVLS